MSPDRTEGGFTQFKGLDEFVIRPMHAGSFGPNFMDTCFGARYKYGECITFLNCLHQLCFELFVDTIFLYYRIGSS